MCSVHARAWRSVCSSGDGGGGGTGRSKEQRRGRGVRGEKLVCSERRSTAVVKRSSVHRQHSSLTSRSSPATW